MQNEIKFINKLISMRKAADRTGSNKKPFVMQHVLWLERHIQANGYSSAKTAKGFFIRELERIQYVMFWSKDKLVQEFENLNKVST